MANVMVWSLAKGKPMEIVIDTMGEPDHQRTGTCGGETKKPWPCKVIVWITKEQADGDELAMSIAFEQSGDTWFANACRVEAKSLPGKYTPCEVAAKRMSKQFGIELPTPQKPQPKEKVPTWET
jgi:hypothetical protein